MDKLTIISGCLFLAADIFAIASLANPDWINTGESAGEGAPGAGGCRCPVLWERRVGSCRRARCGEAQAPRRTCRAGWLLPAAEPAARPA